MWSNYPMLSTYWTCEFDKITNIWTKVIFNIFAQMDEWLNIGLSATEQFAGLNHFDKNWKWYSLNLAKIIQGKL